MVNEKKVVKDFVAFEKGIQRLNQLRKEFETLKTKGFTTEVTKIQTKLKNVTAIPFIEKQLADIKTKIAQQNSVKTTHSPIINEHATHVTTPKTQSPTSQQQSPLKQFAGLFNKQMEAAITLEINHRAQQLTETYKNSLETHKKRWQTTQEEKLKKIEDALTLKHNATASQHLKQKEHELSKDLRKKFTLDLKKLQTTLADEKNKLSTTFKQKCAELTHQKKQFSVRFNATAKEQLQKKVATEFNKRIAQEKDALNKKLAQHYNATFAAKQVHLVKAYQQKSAILKTQTENLKKQLTKSYQLAFVQKQKAFNENSQRALTILALQQRQTQLEQNFSKKQQEEIASIQRLLKEQQQKIEHAHH